MKVGALATKRIRRKHGLRTELVRADRTAQNYFSQGRHTVVSANLPAFDIGKIVPRRCRVVGGDVRHQSTCANSSNEAQFKQRGRPGPLFPLAGFG
jgi:hypothetical protein